MTPTPLFLFSLPRSGSTLCQRILGAAPRIATAAESWLLLPLLYSLRPQGVYAEYNHRLAAEAVEDFCGHLPGGREDYLAEVAALAARLYARAAAPHGGAAYFLDKTPRYTLVADDICRMFPQGKFLFLWRNPLAVIASIIETWGRGRWNLHTSKVDLFRGVDGLLGAYARHGARAHAVRYEDLITDPAAHWPRVYEYLGLPFDPSVLESFAGVCLEGRMGDKVGVRYTSVSREPLSKWHATLASPYRKWWCARYLRWVGAERLSVMGYDLPGLLSELRALPARPQRLVPDLLRAGCGWADHGLELRILRDKLRCLPAWDGIYAHR